MKKTVKKKYSFFSLFLRIIVYAAAFITLAVVVLLLGYIVVKGLPNLSPKLFEWEYNSQNVTLMPALINTLMITVLAMLIATPIGVFSAIYLNEYAKKGNRFISVIRLAAETLSGIPSIVYGLFGMIFFVITLGWGYSLLAGAFTLAIMILPLIMRTTEEALMSVPNLYREGSYGLGAGKLRTVFAIVLPSAIPGILSGIILSIGRIVGETAALIFTAGTLAQIPNSPFGSARTLAVHMYSLSSEGLYLEETYATSLVLLILVIIINYTSEFLAKRMVKKRNG